MQNVNNVKVVPIESVVPNEWNPNVQSEYVFEKEIESIRANGLIAPVLVRRKGDQYEIVDGEHRWRAATQLGFKEIMVNDLEDMPDGIAQQLTIILNDVKGRSDKTKLSALIGTLSKTFSFEDLMKSLPYTEQELKSHIAVSDIDWDSLDRKNDSANQDQTDWRTITVRVPEAIQLQWNEQMTRIKKALSGEESFKDVSDVTALECLLQHIAQINDDQLA